MQVCGICNKHFTRNFKDHIENEHNMIFEDYLREYHFGKVVGYCLYCGEKTNITVYKYSKYCNNTCQLKYQYENESDIDKSNRIIKHKNSWTEESKQKMSTFMKDQQSNKSKDQFKLEKNKAKQTKLERYGDDSYGDFGSERFKKILNEKYGVDNIFELVEYSKPSKEKYNKIKQTFKEKYNSEWIPRSENFDCNIDKRIETCNEKYGVDHYVQSENYKNRSFDIIKKIWETKKENGTTNSSKIEDKIFEILQKNFKTIYREYSSVKYPFSCDFYIEDIDLYIEYQGFFTHGYKSFENSVEDLLKLEKWENKAKTSDFYKNAINIWTKSDVNKRETAFINKLNYLEIFCFKNEENLLQQIYNVINGLELNYDYLDLFKEYSKIKNEVGSLDSKPIYNKIIKTFQPHFYNAENELYKTDPIIRRKLIQNRIKYLKKKEFEISNRELLSGFKISGIHKGYSFFSPFWIKWFIEKFKIKSIYDPFGGWGHRLLGTSDLDLYIYNDIDKRTCDGVLDIIDCFDITNTKIYNNNAENFIPNEDFEAIFTCPPYDNIEKYSNNIEDFEKLLKNTFCNFKNKIIGIIIREDFEDLLINIFGNFEEKLILNNQIDHFKTKKLFEFLYIFRS